MLIYFAEAWAQLPCWAALMLAGTGLLAAVTDVNSGIGGAISIKAFMMVMIDGAGVISGAIFGGFILGMLESVGFSVFHAYGDLFDYFYRPYGVLELRAARTHGQMLSEDVIRVALIE